MTNYREPDRWKCPNCGKITVDPGAPIAACACGCEQVQLREWPSADDWEPPEWPEWSDYSADPYENESFIVFCGEPHGREVVEADNDEVTQQ